MMKSEIYKTISHLEKGNIILCPTDTIWGISCDAQNYEAVEKVYKIKKRDKNKSLVVLVSDLEMLKSFVNDIPKDLLQFLAKQQRPTTIVYKKANNLAENIVAKDKSVAIRIVQEGFIKKLIQTYQKPLVSTSANFSGKETAKYFSEIDDKLKSLVDFVVDTKYDSKNKKSSSIFKYTKGKYLVLRE